MAFSYLIFIQNLSYKFSMSRRNQLIPIWNTQNCIPRRYFNTLKVIEQYRFDKSRALSWYWMSWVQFIEFIKQCLGYTYHIGSLRWLGTLSLMVLIDRHRSPRRLWSGSRRREWGCCNCTSFCCRQSGRHGSSSVCSSPVSQRWSTWWRRHRHHVVFPTRWWSSRSGPLWCGWDQ